MAVEQAYTHGHHESVLRSHRWRTAENSAAHLLPHLRPGMSLLDIGCGPGSITVDLAARVAPGRVTAVEVSDGALELARTYAAQRGQDNIDFVVADAHTLDLPDAAFDVVHAHQVLQHLADPVLALEQLRRVCRPGGIVAARDGDYAGFTWYPQEPALDEWLALVRKAMRANGGEPDAGRRLLSWARAAGFTDVTASASVWCFADEAGRQFWGGMWAQRMVHSDIARQAVDSGMSTVDGLARISQAWLDWVASGDGWFCALNGEIVCRVPSGA